MGSSGVISCKHQNVECRATQRTTSNGAATCSDVITNASLSCSSWFVCAGAVNLSAFFLNPRKIVEILQALAVQEFLIKLCFELSVLCFASLFCAVIGMLL